MINVVPVVLCGGSGTRLLPLSRTGFPKQILCLAGRESLFQQAALRLANLGSSNIQVVAPRCLHHRNATSSGQAANGTIVILGVTPDKPETGYGYIQINQAEANAGVNTICHFVEKPDPATAQAYVNKGGPTARTFVQTSSTRTLRVSPLWSTARRG